MLHVIIYGAIGVAVVAVLVAVFIRTGEKEAAANPRRTEALLVESSGDPALINLYYKARSDEERAEIAGFARAAQPDPEGPEAPAEAEVLDDTGAFADFPEEEEAAAEKKPGLLERHRARREAKAAAAAAAAAEAAKVTVRLSDQAGEKYDDLESAMAAAISQLEGPPAASGEALPAKAEEAAPAPGRENAPLPPEMEAEFTEPCYMLYHPAPETAAAPAAAREENQPPDPSLPRPAPKEESQLCTYCGAELELGCKFCIICGMPAQDIEVRPSAPLEPAPPAAGPAAAAPAPAAEPELMPEPAPSAEPEPAPEPEQAVPLALDPFADRSAYVAARVLPQEAAVAPEAEADPAAAATPAEAAADSAEDSAGDGGGDSAGDGSGEPEAAAGLPPVYSLEEILRNVRQLEKRISREEDGDIGYHDAE